jgi:hypothetical protein
MITVSIASSDVKRVLKNLDRYNVRTQNAIAKVIDDTASRIDQTAKGFVPVNTGRLRSSVHVKRPAGETGFPRLTGRVDRFNLIVGTAVKYGAVVEMGSRAHVIRAKKKPYLHFKIDGRWVRIKQVNHPGTRKQPYMNPSARIHAPKFIAQLKREIKLNAA